MATAHVDPRVCDPGRCADGRCRLKATCPTKAILQFEAYEPPATVTSRCHGCAKCVSDCPSRAVSMV